MNQAPRLVLGLDFGGTKLAAGVIDLGNLTVVDSAEASTPAEAGAEASLGTMLNLARRLHDIAAVQEIGVSFGGHVRDHRVLRSLHVSGWEQFPLRDRLAQHFGVSQVSIANDANAMGLAEWHFGAGRGANSLLYLTVSTGIGGAVILGGRLLEGLHGMAGEIGHMKIVPNGPMCTCGASGCLEAVAAGPAIVRQARKALRHDLRRPSELRGLRVLTGQLIANCANQGDALAIEVLQDAGRWLGRGIANALTLLDVQAVVVGGGVARAGRDWWDAVVESVEESVIPWSRPADVRRSELGESGGIWGGAALVLSGGAG